MSAVERIENLVLGGGEAGKYVAWELAKQGRATMVVERALVGGSCPNIACLPSKNIVRSAKVADLVRHASSYGIQVTPGATFMEGVRGRKREMVDGMIEIHRKRFAVPNLEFVLGDGRFVAPHSRDSFVRRRPRKVVGDRVSEPLHPRRTPRHPGLAASEPLTHVGALELQHLPEHLIVLGGGYVGVELAQAFRRFGSRVTIVQRGPQLLPREDADVAEAVQAIFEQDGIEIILGAETYAVGGRSGDQIHLQLRAAGGERVLEGSDLLVATGRTPNTHGSGSTCGRRAGSQRLREGRRPPTDDCIGRLGDGRVRRQRAVHSRGLR